MKGGYRRKHMLRSVTDLFALLKYLMHIDTAMYTGRIIFLAGVKVTLYLIFLIDLLLYLISILDSFP